MPPAMNNSSYSTRTAGAVSDPIRIVVRVRTTASVRAARTPFTQGVFVH